MMDDILPNGMPEEVKALIREMMETQGDRQKNLAETQKKVREAFAGDDLDSEVVQVLLDNLEHFAKHLLFHEKQQELSPPLNLAIKAFATAYGELMSKLVDIAQLRDQALGRAPSVEELRAQEKEPQRERESTGYMDMSEFGYTDQ